MINLDCIQYDNKSEYVYFDELENYGIKLLNDTSDLNNITNNKDIDIDTIILSNSNIYYINFGNYILCEISNNLHRVINKFNENIFIYHKVYGWYFINYFKLLRIEINNQIIYCFKCSKINKYNDYDIFDYIGGERNFSKIEHMSIANARCNESMKILDTIHRNYLQKYKFKHNDNVAIKAVAGSGKTTTLLNLALNNSKKKILYLAFNKKLIEEIKEKKFSKKINNIFPKTFDSLMRDIFIHRIKLDNYNIIDLKPSNIANYFEDFKTGNWSYYNVKKNIIKKIDKFCNQVKYTNIEDFLKNDDNLKKKSTKWKQIFINIWNEMEQYNIITFNSIRKIIQINNWADDFIDNKYDMILIDEAQDFDILMLSILLTNTTLPKIYVGDPLQAIYEWRGSINTFEHLPENSLLIELYSTFRIGNPACEEVRNNFNDCWMISKSNNNTIIEYEVIPKEKYTYLFRSWKGLLLTAKITKNIYIYNYDKKIIDIKRQHEYLTKNPNKTLSKEEASEFEDDLPQFLIKLSLQELTELLNDIELNLVNEEEAQCLMTTIHSYKGLEYDIIRIYDDIKIESEENIYYVALTRGMKRIILDKKYEKVKSKIKINTHETDCKDYIKLYIENKKINEIARLNNISEEELLLSNEFNNIDFELIDKLKEFRLNKSKELNLPQFIIYSNNLIKEFIIKKPKNKSELLKIKGFGEKLFSKYGVDILTLINFVS